MKHGKKLAVRRLDFKKLSLDVRTRCNNTFKMLKKLWNIKTLFFNILKGSRRSFKWSKDDLKCAKRDSILFFIHFKTNAGASECFYWYCIYSKSSLYWRQILRDLDHLYTDIKTEDFFMNIISVRRCDDWRVNRCKVFVSYKISSK